MALEVRSAAGAPPAVLAPGFAPATKAIREREERPAPRARAFFTFYAGVSQEGGGREGPASSPLTLTTQEDRCLVSCVNPPLSQSRGEPHACARSPFSSVRIGSHPGPPIRGGSFFFGSGWRTVVKIVARRVPGRIGPVFWQVMTGLQPFAPRRRREGRGLCRRAPGKPQVAIPPPWLRSS